MKKMVHLLSNVIIFILGLALIVKGHKSISLQNLGMMILGLSLLIFLLYRYNQKFVS